MKLVNSKYPSYIDIYNVKINDLQYNIDKFKENLKGIIWGEFLGVDEKEFKLWQKEIVRMLEIPMASGFKITHGEHKITLPYGVKATFDADNTVIKIDEEYLN